MPEVAAPEVPNKTSTPGPTPAAFTRLVVDIFGTLDITPLQDALTPFLGTRHFHEELERGFLCILSDFRLKFGLQNPLGALPETLQDPPLGGRGCFLKKWSLTCGKAARNRATNKIAVQQTSATKKHCGAIFCITGPRTLHCNQKRLRCKKSESLNVGFTS